MEHKTLTRLIVFLAVTALCPIVQAQPLTASPSATQRAPAPPAPEDDLPADPVRDLTIRACSTCHAMDMITKQRLSQQGWYDVVQMMGDRGALATTSELEQIAAYLHRCFPEE